MPEKHAPPSETGSEIEGREALTLMERMLNMKPDMPTVPARLFPPPSHGMDAETLEAKARWFQRFTMAERFALFLAWADFLLELNPRLLERKQHETVSGGFRVQRVGISHGQPFSDRMPSGEVREGGMLSLLKRVFDALNRHQVRYLVVGGVAAIVHGLPRATFDLDIWIAPDEDNARCLLQALEEAGFGTATLTTPRAVVEHEITVFQDWIRVDVFTRIPGLTFDSAWERRDLVQAQGARFWVLSLDDLITAKKASGRPQDLEDARFLEEQRRTNQE